MTVPGRRPWLDRLVPRLRCAASAIEAKLLALLFVVSFVALFPSGSGTRFCIVCGSHEDRAGYGPVTVARSAPRAGDGERVALGRYARWFEDAGAPEHEHTWEATGCEWDGGRIVCSTPADVYAFHRVMPALPESLGRVFLHRLVRADAVERRSLWFEFERDPFAPAAGGPRESVAAHAAWLELHPRWR